MVRLKELIGFTKRGLLVPFRFQNGSIKSGISDIHIDGFLKRFDSKMVRLKASGTAGGTGTICTFRFQNGSIKSETWVLQAYR